MNKEKIRGERHREAEENEKKRMIMGQVQENKQKQQIKETQNKEII